MWRPRKTKKRSRPYRQILFLIIAGSLIVLILLTNKKIIGLFSRQNIISPLPTVLNKKINSQEEKKNEFKKELEEELLKTNLGFSEIIFTQDSLLSVKLASGEKITFSLRKPVKSQVSSLQLMLSRFTIEGKKVEQLDFRFDKPVVVFKK